MRSSAAYQATAALLLRGPGAPTIPSLQFLSAMQTLLDEIDHEFERLDIELRNEAEIKGGPYVTPAPSLEASAQRRFRRS